jgi:hypothetical protein
MTFKPWIGTFFGLLFSGAMERKTGLRKWRILSRIVAAQFRRFGLATLALRFIPFRELAAIKQFRGIGQKSPSFAVREQSARTARAGTRASDTCREEANVRGPCTSIGAWKNARAGDVRGAE